MEGRAAAGAQEGASDRGDGTSAEYNVFWNSYITECGTRPSVSNRRSRLTRDTAVSHRAMRGHDANTFNTSNADGGQDADEAGAVVTVVAPSPFDYIASLLRQRAPATAEPSQTPPTNRSRTWHRFDVETAKRSLQEAADSLCRSSPERTHTPRAAFSEGEESSTGSAVGLTNSRRGGESVFTPSGRPHWTDCADVDRQSSPLATTPTEAVPVPRQLFSPNGHRRVCTEAVACAEEESMEAEEIVLSDVSCSDNESASRSPQPAMSVVAGARPTPTPLFDIDVNIASRHASVLKVPSGDSRGTRLSQPPPRPPVPVSDPQEMTTLWDLYGARLRPEEWQHPELRAFLAFREQQAERLDALSSAPSPSHHTNAAEVTVAAQMDSAFRRVYAASAGRRTAERSAHRTPAVFVARPTPSAGKAVRALDDPIGVLQPTSSPSRFLEWVACDVDLYQGLVLSADKAEESRAHTPGLSS